MINVHAGVRSALAEERPADEAHLATCPSCADFAKRLARVRAIAPSLGQPAAPLDLAETVLARLAGATGTGAAALGPGHDGARTLKRALWRSGLSAAAVLAAVLVASNLLPAGGPGAPADLSNVLLASADVTAARDTARLRLEGRAQTTVVRDGRAPVVSAVSFAGAGELVAGEGMHVSLTSRRAGEGLATATYEYLALDGRAFSRRLDGRWDEVEGPSGPLAAVLLDAETSLDMLRAAKRELVDLGTDASGWRHLRFEVVHPAPLGRPGAQVNVDAWVGRDDLLRRITLTCTGRADQGEATVAWETVTTLGFSDFGADVRLVAPAAGDVVGRATVAVEAGQAWLAD